MMKGDEDQNRAKHLEPRVTRQRAKQILDRINEKDSEHINKGSETSVDNNPNLALTSQLKSKKFADKEKNVVMDEFGGYLSVTTKQKQTTSDDM